MRTKITLNTVAIIALITTMPNSALLYALGALVSINLAVHYRKLGGRWSDDWGQSIIESNYFATRDEREKMDSFCLCYRCSLIMTFMMTLGAVIHY